MPFQIKWGIAKNKVKLAFRGGIENIPAFDMCVRIQEACHLYRLWVKFGTVGVRPIRQPVEEIAHATAEIGHPIGLGGSRHFNHKLTNRMRGKELPHFKLFFSLRIIVEVVEIIK